VGNKHRIHVGGPHKRAVDVLGGLNLAADFSLVAVDGLLVRSRLEPTRPPGRMSGGRGFPYPVPSAAEGIPGWGLNEDFAG
jgi:hypothetical protein